MARAFTIRGEKALMAKVQRMSRQGSARVARPAVRAGARPMVKAARALVAKQTRTLFRSIGMVAVTGRAGPYVVIGPRTGMAREVVRPGFGAQTAVPTKYAHLVEYGTARGAVAQPFMRPAFDQTHQESMTIIQKRMWQEIAKLVKKGLR